MKTFEERYTAWIDGELEGGALNAFEQELARRAAEGEAVADKAGATRLRALLQTHLQAPTLTNPDFFSHQLRERIDAETTAASRGRESGRRGEPTVFAWGLARLIGLGAMSLFAAAALYYGMMPPHVGSLSDPAAASRPVAVNHTDATGGEQGANAGTTPFVLPEAHPQNDDDIKVVLRSPTPSPIDMTPDIRTYVPDQPINPAAITPLHYNQSNVNVLWLNGLEHFSALPDAVPSSTDNVTPAAATPLPAPPAGGQ